MLSIDDWICKNLSVNCPACLILCLCRMSISNLSQKKFLKKVKVLSHLTRHNNKGSFIAYLPLWLRKKHNLWMILLLILLPANRWIFSWSIQLLFLTCKSLPYWMIGEHLNSKNTWFLLLLLLLLLLRNRKTRLTHYPTANTLSNS